MLEFLVSSITVHNVSKLGENPARGNPVSAYGLDRRLGPTAFVTRGRFRPPVSY